MTLGLRWLPFTAALLLATAACAQVQTPSPISNTPPTPDFGFNLPTQLGTVRYSLTGSNIYMTGGDNLPSDDTVAFSGNFAALTSSVNNPFSVIYSGGYLHNTQLYQHSTTFQNLALSQVFKAQQWIFVVSDAASYLPDAPTVGLSGIAGVGDIGVAPIEGVGPNDTILSNYGRQVSNGLNASANYQVTGATTLDVSGAWRVLDYLDRTGYNTRNYSGSAGGTHRFDARNSVGAQAAYSRYLYTDYPISFDSESLLFNYDRIWSAAWNTSVSIGPERSIATGPAASPAQWMVAATATANYAGRSVSATFDYHRGVNGGSGIIPGTVTNTLFGSVSHPMGRDWSVSGTAEWSRSTSLQTVSIYDIRANTEDISGQVSRKISTTLSGYASYTALHQSFVNASALGTTSNALTGLRSEFAVGITFSPAPLHRGR